MKGLRYAALLTGFGVCMPAASLAIDYTFAAASSGNWNSSINWYPVGIPMAGDTATIPNGKTCNITADASIDSFTIESGGHLNLIGKTLSVVTSGTCTVDSPFVMDNDVSNNPPILKLEGTVLFTTSSPSASTGISATIDCATSCAPAQITFVSVFNGGTIELDNGVFVTGSIDFKGVDIDINSGGELVIDDAGYVMRVGTNGYVSDLVGDGSVNISAGRLEFDIAHGGSNSDWLITQTGGTFKVGSAASVGSTDLNVHLSGGTLDVDSNLGGKEFEFTGGTIDVAANKTVLFQE